MDMEGIGRTLVVLGVLLVLVGALLWLVPSVPLLGRLPGDIRIERPGFRFYFPLTTSLVISVVLSLLLGVISRMR